MVKNLLSIFIILIFVTYLNITKMATVAGQILQQLGGSKFTAMVGAKHYQDNGGNTLVTKFKGSRIANIMYITLNSMDLYDVKICKYKGMELKTVKEVKNCYCDTLTEIFEETTGLRTSL